MRKNLHINENLPEDILESIVISSTEYAIIATDIHNRIIIWNKGAELIYGYSKEEMLGKQFPPDLHRKGLPNNEFLFVPNNETKSRPHFHYPRVNKNNKTLGLLILTREDTSFWTNSTVY